MPQLAQDGLAACVRWLSKHKRNMLGVVPALALLGLGVCPPACEGCQQSAPGSSVSEVEAAGSLNNHVKLSPFVQ